MEMVICKLQQSEAMKISSLLERDSSATRFSIEVFPPTDTKSRGSRSLEKHLSSIFTTVRKLKKYNPLFVSVTFNPTGKTHTTSFPVASMIKHRYGVETLSHLTCNGISKKEMEKILDVLNYLGIDNILALRGDEPENSDAVKDDFNHAYQLVEKINAHKHDFSISVAGYPEVHPECVDNSGKRDMSKNIQHFKNKISCGADFAITQLFLDNSSYFEFIKKARKSGIDIPIFPGIMPVVSMRTMEIIKNLTGAKIPGSFAQKLENNREDKKEIMELGIEHAVMQCKGLIGKVPNIHFYSMNKWKPIERIIQEIM